MEEDVMWQVVGITSGLVAGAVARKAVVAAWTGSTGRDVPDNPAAPGVRWPEAIAFAVVSGAVLGLTRMLAQRGAAEAWHAATGSYPSSVEKERA